MEPESWTRDWPRCQLLLELASQYTLTGRTQGSHKLLARLEGWRERMGVSAPDVVLSFINELCYATWLLTREERGEAQHHIVQASHKARQIKILFQRQQRQEIRERGALLCRRSDELRAKVQGLLQRSMQLIAQSLEVRRRQARPSPGSGQESRLAG
jgi:hypothetical protein